MLGILARQLVMSSVIWRQQKDSVHHCSRYLTPPGENHTWNPDSGWYFLAVFSQFSFVQENVDIKILQTALVCLLSRLEKASVIASLLFFVDDLSAVIFIKVPKKARYPLGESWLYCCKKAKIPEGSLSYGICPKRVYAAKRGTVLGVLNLKHGIQLLFVVRCLHVHQNWNSWDRRSY